MGEVATFAQVLTHTGLLKAIQEQVRFTRPRVGHYDTVDFVVVLIGYALTPVAALPQAPPTVPEPIPRFPVLWQDWPRCQIRRNWCNR
jgi:hypothetical protein